uniref:Uncharacterized protein n=1 Tax=Anguilla anguilla TaxID=7936 RepID=A0A0E9SHA1_ANGAN
MKLRLIVILVLSGAALKFFALYGTEFKSKQFKSICFKWKKCIPRCNWKFNSPFKWN